MSEIMTLLSQVFPLCTVKLNYHSLTTHVSMYLLTEGDLGKEISTKFEKEEQFLVTVLTAMGEEQAVGIKAMTK